MEGFIMHFELLQRQAKEQMYAALHLLDDAFAQAYRFAASV